MRLLDFSAVSSLRPITHRWMIWAGTTVRDQVPAPKASLRAISSGGKRSRSLSNAQRRGPLTGLQLTGQRVHAYSDVVADQARSAITCGSCAISRGVGLQFAYTVGVLGQSVDLALEPGPISDAGLKLFR
jgi:hypothetical protein